MAGGFGISNPAHPLNPINPANPIGLLNPNSPNYVGDRSGPPDVSAAGAWAGAAFGFVVGGTAAAVAVTAGAPLLLGAGMLVGGVAIAAAAGHFIGSLFD
jgi:hypothetical protein